MSDQSVFPAASLAPSPISILTHWAQSTRAFRRNRVAPELKVLAAALCNAGYSYREVSKMVGGMSYIAAKDAYFSLLTSLPEESRRYRRAVAIDGGDFKASGRTFHFWLAREIDTGEIMDFCASPDASAPDGARFLSRVAQQCTSRPFLRLGSGENAPVGLVNLDLYFQASPAHSLIGRIGRLLTGARE